MEKFAKWAGGLLIFLGVMVGITALVWGNTQVGDGDGKACGSYWSPEKASEFDETTGNSTDVAICPDELGNGGAFAVLLLVTGIGLVAFGGIAISLAQQPSSEADRSSAGSDSTELTQ